MVGFVNAHNIVGIVHARKGNLDEAMRSFRRAIEINPAFEEARANLEHLTKMMEDKVEDKADRGAEEWEFKPMPLPPKPYNPYPWKQKEEGIILDDAVDFFRSLRKD